MDILAQIDSEIGRLQSARALLAGIGSKSASKTTKVKKNEVAGLDA